MSDLDKTISSLSALLAQAKVGTEEIPSAVKAYMNRVAEEKGIATTEVSMCDLLRELNNVASYATAQKLAAAAWEQKAPNNRATRRAMQSRARTKKRG